MNINALIRDWAWRVNNGMPDPKNRNHIELLEAVLRDHKYSEDFIREYIQNLNEGTPAEEAEKLGLVHLGGTAYGPKKGGEPTHKTKDGKLVSVDSDDVPTDVKDKEEPEQEKSSSEEPDGQPSEESPEEKAKKSKHMLDNPEPGSDADQEMDNKESSEEAIKEKVESIVSDLYPGNKLLQNSETSEAALKNGYKKGADYVAPGNAGSNFNENMSNEAALIAEKYPDLDESELASVIFEIVKDTKLGKQQKSTTVDSPTQNDRGTIPSTIKSKDERNLFRSSIIAARSGLTKSNRAKEGAKLAQESKGFGKETKMSTFGGTATDLENLKDKIVSANKIYITDNGQVYEMPKAVIQEWIAASGGGENASDTAVITEDGNGNLIYDGWSDKKTFKDFQGNSTLNDDYTKQIKNISKLEASGRVDSVVAKEAKNIVAEAKNQSAKIEKSYKKASVQEAAFLSTYAAKDMARLSEHLKNQEAGYVEKSTNNHIANAMRFYKVKTHDELLVKLLEEAQTGKSSSDRLKIITRMATDEREHLKQTSEIPDGLNTNKIISNAREQALSLQKKTQNKLNKLTGSTSTGKEKPMGDVIGFQETIDFLHLDKIKEPENTNDYKQILKRNTQLVMAGKAVTPERLKGCLGVNSLDDAENRFSVVTDEELVQNADKTMTTGKVVYIYAVNSEDETDRKFIGEKRYRSKDGATGKTSNTIQWSPDMQKCFDK
tara:strand:- start:40892 stop:43048 length:2157 start_codon:yes stop_codon:yes gene_type:complete